MERRVERSLVPREHGAYAQLLLPLGAALAGSRPTTASGCLALAACAAFLAHEPALVLLGRRGARARREAAKGAWRWLSGASIVAVAAGLSAFVLAPAARVWMAPCAVLCALAAFLVTLGRERTLGGELAALGALTSAALPTAVAGGVVGSDALALAGVFCAASAITTVEVRSIAGHPASAGVRVAVWACAGAVIAWVGMTRGWLAAATAPVIAVLGVALVTRPTPKKLRALGWALATASLVMAASVAIAVR